MKIERDIIPETYFKVLKQALVFGNAKKQTSFYLYKKMNAPKKKSMCHSAEIWCNLIIPDVLVPQEIHFPCSKCSAMIHLIPRNGKQRPGRRQPRRRVGGKTNTRESTDRGMFRLTRSEYQFLAR